MVCSSMPYFPSFGASCFDKRPRGQELIAFQKSLFVLVPPSGIEKKL